MPNVPLISVVDDDDSVRESLSGLIRSVGFRVMVFASAEEFLNSNRLSDTNCLILDVRMPGMNGLELRRRLAASHSSIPVVFITAHGDEEARAQALNAGINVASCSVSTRSLAVAMRLYTTFSQSSLAS